ncbi:TetR family transcriptional regulator C-terminal domain-containing protein [Hoeflea sp. TYP-13]|uniref:TetR family transcriptional regulator C-terminal domain-containing protein n=1 Tax=Hoeflea sp. TYP-13 TaxID=3230023 RepID=UPI0034C6448C
MSAREKVLDRRQKIRQAIHEAAIEEFSANGLVGASTQAIARRAGLSKPQLHYYISSKEELYEETLLFIIDKWKDQFFLSIQSDDPKTVISEYIAIKVRHALAEPKLCRLFANEVARGAPILKRHWSASRESVEKAADIMRSWIADGKIKPVDPYLFQMEMWAVTQHFADYEAQVRFMLDLGEDHPIDENRIIADVTALFLRACGLEPDG